jgi:hypothetical protein
MAIEFRWSNPTLAQGRGSPRRLSNRRIRPIRQPPDLADSTIAGLGRGFAPPARGRSGRDQSVSEL